jgi:Transposase DDE domain
MASVPSAAAPLPTELAALPRLLAYTQAMGLEHWLARPKRGVPTLVLALFWLVLAWRGSGRPEHAALLDEPLLVTVLGQERRPNPSTLLRSLDRFSAQGVRRALEAAYRATLRGRTGRAWVALDSHQVPYYGRGKRDQFRKGWAGNHGRRLRGYRLFLAVDTTTGQLITYLVLAGNTADATLAAVLVRRLRQLLGRRLAGVVGDCGFTSHAALAALLATGVPFILGFGRSKPIQARLAALSHQHRRWLRDGGAIRLGDCPWDARLRLFAVGARSPTDDRGPWVYVTSLRSYGPQRLATLYRRRGRIEQTIDELCTGHDLDHLVSYHLHPNRVALGFRLLARNLSIGLQLAETEHLPTVIREPHAFRTAHVHGLGTFTAERRTIHIHPLRPMPPQHLRLSWTRRVVRLVA